MRRYVVLLWLLLALLPLTACNSARQPVSETRDDGQIEGTLWSAHRYYERDELVHLRFTLKNITDEEITLMREDGPVVDIVIRGARWSQGAGADRDLSQLTLAPGETYQIEWRLASQPQEVHGEWWNVWGRRQYIAVFLCYSGGPC